MVFDGVLDYFTKKPRNRYDDDDAYFDDEYEEEAYEEEEEREPQSFMDRFKRDNRDRSRSSFSGDSYRGEERGFDNDYEEERRTAPARLILVKAKGFSEIRRIAENLNQNRSVIINFEDMDKSEAQRSMDFLSGTTFAHDGHVQKVSHCTFIFAVGAVDIIGRIEEIKDTESYFTF